MYMYVYICVYISQSWRVFSRTLCPVCFMVSTWLQCLGAEERSCIALTDDACNPWTHGTSDRPLCDVTFILLGENEKVLKWTEVRWVNRRRGSSHLWEPGTPTSCVCLLNVNILSIEFLTRRLDQTQVSELSGRLMAKVEPHLASNI